MTAGYRLKNLFGNLLSIDDEGNLLLDTKGKMAGQNQNADIPNYGGAGIPTNIGISNGVGASSNICNVTYQVTDLAGVAVAGNFEFDVLLSDAATGLGLTATAPSGGVAAAASGGTVIGTLTASKCVRVQTNSSGAFILAITDTAKTLYYPVGYWGGRDFVGAQLTSGSYHS